MENTVVSTRGIRLLFKNKNNGHFYAQAVILEDGRKLVITGSTYGAGAPITALAEAEVARKSDLEWAIKDLVNHGYQQIDGSAHYDELREINNYMPYDS